MGSAHPNYSRREQIWLGGRTNILWSYEKKLVNVIVGHIFLRDALTKILRVATL